MTTNDDKNKQDLPPQYDETQTTPLYQPYHEPASTAIPINTTTTTTPTNDNNNNNNAPVTNSLSAEDRKQQHRLLNPHSAKLLVSFIALICAMIGFPGMVMGGDMPIGSFFAWAYLVYFPQGILFLYNAIVMCIRAAQYPKWHMMDGDSVELPAASRSKSFNRFLYFAHWALLAMNILGVIISFVLCGSKRLAAGLPASLILIALDLPLLHLQHKISTRSTLRYYLVLEQDNAKQAQERAQHQAQHQPQQFAYPQYSQQQASYPQYPQQAPYPQQYSQQQYPNQPHNTYPYYSNTNVSPNGYQQM